MMIPHTLRWLMRPAWSMAPALLVLATTALHGHEPATSAEQVSDLVRELGNDRYAVRGPAVAALRKQSVLLVPRLEKQLASLDRLEHRRRLESVIAELRRLPWHIDLAAAKAEARACGKPLLVLSTLGELSGFG